MSHAASHAPSAMHKAPPLKRFDFFSLQDFTSPLKAQEPVQQEQQPEAAPAEAAPPPAPTYDEAQLEAARKEGFAEGRAKGLEEAETEMQQQGIEATKQLAGAAAQINDALKHASDHISRHITEQQDALLHCARAMAQKLALGALDDRAEEVLRDMVMHCLPHIVREPALHIQVAPDMLERLRAIMDEGCAKTGYAGNVTLDADEQMMAGDIRIEWAAGTAERSYGQLLADMDAALDITPATPEPMDKAEHAGNDTQTIDKD